MDPNAVKPFQGIPRLAARSANATPDYLEASLQLTDSGSDADIDDVDPVPLTSGRKKSRRRLVHKQSMVRDALLRLIEDELDSWKEPDVSLQALVSSLTGGRNLE